MKKRLVSIVLVLSMILSMAPSAFAATPSDSNNDGVISYVSLGDSMTNAYGLPGYDYDGHDASIDCDVVDCTNPAHQIRVSVNGYLQSAPGAYPTLFANWLESETGKEVDITQLAISGSRIEELLFLLEVDYEDDDVIQFLHDARMWGSGQNLSAPYINSYFDEAAWDAMFDHGDVYTWRHFVHFRGASRWFDENFRRLPGNDIPAGESIIKHVARKHQEAIAAADIINIGNGNADLGVFLLGRLINALGGSAGSDGDDSWITLEAALKQCDPETRAIVLNAYADVKEVLLSQIDAGTFEPVLEPIANVFAYTLANYFFSYQDMMNRILELNPDAEIMQLGVLNVLQDFKVDYHGQIFEMGDAIQILVDAANVYMAAVPAAYQMAGDEKYAQATFYYFDAKDIDLMRTEYSTAMDAGWKDYETIRDRLIFEINAQTVFELVGPIVNAVTDGIMQQAGAQAGVPLNGSSLAVARNLNRYDVEEYERYLEAMAAYEEAKAAYELDNTLPEPVEPTTYLSNSQILAVATYLACEYATVEASKVDALDMSTFEGLASWQTLVNEVVSMGNLVADRVVYQNMQEITDGLVAALTADVTADITAIVTAWVTAGGEARMTEIGTYAYTNGKDFNTAALELYVAQNTAAYNSAYAASVKKHAETFVTDYISGHITPVLAEEMMNNKLIMGLLNLYISLQAGGGVSMHPSGSGHVTIAEAAIAAYRDGHTAKDETIENLKALIEAAYQEAYKYAAENGYLDIAAGYLTEAEAAVNAAIPVVEGLSVAPQLELTKTLLADELKNTAETIDALEALLASENLDWAAVMTLANEIQDHVETIEALATELGVLNDLALTQLQQASDYVGQVMTEAAANAYAWVVTNGEDFAKAYAAFVEKIGTAVDQISPELGKAVREYLTETPEEALAILYAAGEEAVTEFIAAAVAVADNVEVIIEGLSAILMSDIKAYVDAVAASPEVAAALAQIKAVEAELKQTSEEFINAPASTAMIYQQKIAELETELITLQDTLIMAIVAAIKGVDPCVAQMVNDAMIALGEAIAIAEQYGEQYGKWFAGRFDQMAGDLLNLIITKTEELGGIAGPIIDTLIWNFINGVKEDILEGLDKIEIADISLAALKDLIADLNEEIITIETQLETLKGYTGDGVDSMIAALEAELAEAKAYLAKLNTLAEKVENLVNEIENETDLTVEKVQGIIATAQDIVADTKNLVTEAQAALVALKNVYEETMPQLIAALQAAEGPAGDAYDVTAAEIEAFVSKLQAGYDETVAAFNTAAANIDVIVTDTVAAVCDSVATAISSIKDATVVAYDEICAAVMPAIEEIKAQAIMLANSTDKNIRAAGEQILEKIEALEQAYDMEAYAAQFKAVEGIINELIAEVEGVEDVEAAEAFFASAAIALGELAGIAEGIYSMAAADAATILKDIGVTAQDIIDIVNAAAGEIGGDAISAYNASAQAVMTAVNNVIPAVQKAVCAYEVAVVTAAGEIITAVNEAATAIGAEVVVVVNTASEAVNSIVAQGTSGVNTIIDVWTKAFYDATHGELDVYCNSVYVALGNSSAYAEELKALLGEYVTLGSEADLADADLVTIGMDTTGLMADIQGQAAGIIAELIRSSDLNQILALLTEEEKAAVAEYLDLDAEANHNLDWSQYPVDKAVLAAVLAEVKSTLIENDVPENYTWDVLETLMPVLDDVRPGLSNLFRPGGLMESVEIKVDVPVADVLTDMVEYSMYAYAGFIAEYDATYKKIPAGAQIVLTGTYNTMEDLVIADIPVGEYAAYVVSAMDMQPLVYALVNDNTTFVSVQNTGGDAQAMAEAICEALTIRVFDHEWDEGVVTAEPKCDEVGVKTYTCGVCGDTYEEELEVIGHVWGDWTSDGEENHKRVCANDAQHVEYAEHEWDEGVVTAEPKCDEPGVKTYTCGVCGDTYEEELEVIGHAWGDWTSDGEENHKRVCANDAQHVEYEEHEWDNGVVTAKPKCTEPGVKTYTCGVCGETYEEEIEATGHAWGSWTSNGEENHKRVCANDAQHVEYDEHEWDDGVVTAKPKCTEPGVKTYTCGVCGETYEEEIEATGHVWGSWTSNGEENHKRVCANDAQHVEYAGHVYDSDSDTTCNDCGHKRTVSGGGGSPSIPGGGGGSSIPSTPSEPPHSSECPKDATCPVNSFLDTSANEWYHDGIHYCVENGLMQGYLDGTFGPSININRGQIVTILWRQAGSPAPKGECAFADVPEDMYCYEAVAWASENGIALGYEDGTFRPTQVILRQQLAAFLYRYAKWAGVDVSVGKNTNILSYTDAETISEYAIPALQWATGSGVVQGYTDGTIRPLGKASRAHAAMMLQRFCESILK